MLLVFGFSMTASIRSTYYSLAKLPTHGVTPNSQVSTLNATLYYRDCMPFISTVAVLRVHFDIATLPESGSRMRRASKGWSEQ